MMNSLKSINKKRTKGKLIFWIGVVFFALFPLSLLVAVLMKLPYPWTSPAQNFLQFQLITWTYCFVPLIGLALMFCGGFKRMSEKGGDT